MDNSLLFNIKRNVQQYAQVIATVLEMDVDIVDEKLIRIAGTEKFFRSIDKIIDNQGNAFKRVLETKKILIVEEPGKDEVCLTCISNGICKEKYEICCPIILDNKVIGVISLAVFDEEKKESIKEKRLNYMEFLEQISNLIAAKASEYRNFQKQKFALELQKKLLDFINQGVIVFDELDNILHINKKSEEILGNSMEQLIYLKKIKQFSIRRMKKAPNIGTVGYTAQVKAKKVMLIGNIYPIIVSEKEEGKVFVFQDQVSLQKSMLNIVEPEKYSFDNIIGQEKNFLDVKENAKVLAHSNANILINGETGTGKEIFARAIHNESDRKDKAFISVICSGTVEDIIEKEIFGYNLATGDSSVGKIYLAHGGTLFIDEIGDLTPRLQARLIKAIQEKREYNIKLIATTSQDLKCKVESGEFREDLYYSLMAFEITIPPVRSRKKDIMLLANYFLDKYSQLEGKELSLKDDVIKVLDEYSWPGNVREIERMISFMVVTKKGGKQIGADDLHPFIKNQLMKSSSEQYNLANLEKETIIKVLNIYGNTTEGKKRVAAELGIGTATLYRKLDKYGIEEVKNYN